MSRALRTGAPVASLPTRILLPPRTSLRGQGVVTERTMLVPIEPADGPELWDAVDGSRWHLERFLPWVPFNTTAEASQRYAEACAEDWDASRAARLAIRDRNTNRILGVIGLDAFVHLHRSCELGYWLRQEATGRGLMREAAAAAVRYAFDNLQVHRMRCAAATDNHASLRVIAGLGFRFEGIARQAEYVDSRWVDHAVFARLATD